MTEIAPDLLKAATTMAGLLIVYLGGLVARVEGMDESKKSIVGPTYRRRWTLAFVGILAASLAAVLCILSHALNSDLAADIAAVLLAGAFFAAIGAVFIIYGHLHDRF